MSQVLFNKKFTAQTHQLQELRAWTRDAANKAGLDYNRIDKVVIGVNEACMNIIEHAYNKQPGEVIFIVKQEERQLIFELTDFAKTVNCEEIKSRELDDLRPGGLGVHLIHEVMDKVEYLPGPGGIGNIIRMTVNID
jgi:anti-sigma regulatory factor (Ser/Thr protein kinase)